MARLKLLGVITSPSSGLFFRVRVSSNFRQQGGILRTAKGGVFWMVGNPCHHAVAILARVLHSANISNPKIPSLLHYSNKRRWGCSSKARGHPCTWQSQYTIQPLTPKPTILSASFGQTLSVPQALFGKSELPHPHATAPNPNGESERG